MKKLFIVLFMLSAVGLSAVAFLNSELSRIFGLKAHGFGISPPYVKAYSLQPGDEFRQNITIMRGNAGSVKTVNVELSAPGFADWFEFHPGRNFVFPQNQEKIILAVRGRVPDTAVNGQYQGFININLGSEIESGKIGIGLGALAEIDLSVIKGLPGNTEEISLLKGIDVLNSGLWQELRGRLFIRVERNGEIYYLDQQKPVLYGVLNNKEACLLASGQAIGISDVTLAKIPVGFIYGSGNDYDLDGLDDDLEQALGTDQTLPDSDQDGFDDYSEIEKGFDPLIAGAFKEVNPVLAERLSGLFVLQVESGGQLWYVNPVDKKRYYLGRQNNFFNALSGLSSGISEQDFNSLLIGD